MSGRLPASDSGRPTKAPILEVAKFEDRLVAVGVRGLIFTSKDQGTSWEQSASPTDVTLTGIVYLGSKKGFAVGHEETLLRTDDSGITWRLIRTDAAGVPLLRVRFVDSKTGFAVGGRGVIFRTSDGGDSWTRGVVTTEDEFDPHLFDIASIEDGLILAGEGGRLFRSLDGGNSWRELSSPYVGSFFGLLSLGSRAILAYGMLGHAFLSRDGGDNWEELSTGINQSFFSAVATETTVYLAGADGAIVGAPRGDPRRFALAGAPNRLNISGIVSVPNGWLLASDRGLAHAAKLPTNASNR